MDELTFGNCHIEMITRDGELWARGTQIGDALGYGNPGKKIHELYTRHADEFTDSMTAVVKLPDVNPQTGGAGQMREVRIFSLRGAHLLAMFARTKAAKEFRRWVLDILDALHKGGEYVMQQYRRARDELEQGQEAASECGKGLNRWKQIKEPLQARLEYWSERRQLCLALG
ncbi:BRO family protein [Azotobacter beijerinckii]|uniref:BRO family, N-terminal domain n=1 Tax=Azotobacter beijerinckii TaxID=170623 RepID=A0A1I0Z3T1_9GAMM|nr:BRO family protein [Azotobacter beijerinckii]SFB19088.1 BRO family, N-terminal domain [Azotobacter beijerinckii]